MSAASTRPSASGPPRFTGRDGARSSDASLLLLKVQLHAHTVRIVKKDLRITGARHDALAELHVSGLQAFANAFDIGRGKGDMVQTPGVLIFLLCPAHHDAFARLACAHEVYRGNTARIEPVAGKIERRAFAVLQSQHV